MDLDSALNQSPQRIAGCVIDEWYYVMSMPDKRSGQIYIFPTAALKSGLPLDQPTSEQSFTSKSERNSLLQCTDGDFSPVALKTGWVPQ